MDTDKDKYIEARFSNIEDKLDIHLTQVDQRFQRMESDVKEIKREVTGLKFWFVGTAIAIIAIFITLFTYHAQVMQSQMQVFSEYVKSVTQPIIPKTPSTP